MASKKSDVVDTTDVVAENKTSHVTCTYMCKCIFGHISFVPCQFGIVHVSGSDPGFSERGLVSTRGRGEANIPGPRGLDSGCYFPS